MKRRNSKGQLRTNVCVLESVGNKAERETRVRCDYNDCQNKTETIKSNEHMTECDE